jgi:hypothetical protein
MRHVYIRTYTLGAPDPGSVGAKPNPWRIYEGIIIGHKDEDQVLIYYVDELGAYHAEEARHLTERNSASYFVYANEFEMMYRDEQEDWAQKGLWREAWQDAQRIRQELKSRVEVCRSCGSVTGSGNICGPCSVEAGNFQ